ncbi:MAG: hypothetical protein ACTHOH_03275 [Lysobacteraceae bacterium]
MQGTRDAPIPYRSEKGAIGSPALGALAVTVLMLALVVAVLRFARAKGWLDRWIVAPPVAADGRPPLRLERSLRVGPRTTVHRIRDGERSFLLVESLAPSASLHPLDEASSGSTDGHA